MYYNLSCECSFHFYKLPYFAIRTLQNKDNMHFFFKKFAYIKKK